MMSMFQAKDPHVILWWNPAIQDGAAVSAELAFGWTALPPESD